MTKIRAQPREQPQVVRDRGILRDSMPTHSASVPPEHQCWTRNAVPHLPSLDSISCSLTTSSSQPAQQSQGIPGTDLVLGTMPAHSSSVHPVESQGGPNDALWCTKPQSPIPPLPSLGHSSSSPTPPRRITPPGLGITPHIHRQSSLGVIGQGWANGVGPTVHIREMEETRTVYDEDVSSVQAFRGSPPNFQLKDLDSEDVPSVQLFHGSLPDDQPRNLNAEDAPSVQAFRGSPPNVQPRALNSEEVPSVQHFQGPLPDCQPRNLNAEVAPSVQPFRGSLPDYQPRNLNSGVVLSPEDQNALEARILAKKEREAVMTGHHGRRNSHHHNGNNHNNNPYGRNHHFHPNNNNRRPPPPTMRRGSSSNTNYIYPRPPPHSQPQSLPLPHHIPLPRSPPSSYPQSNGYEPPTHYRGSMLNGRRMFLP